MTNMKITDKYFKQTMTNWTQEYKETYVCVICSEESYVNIDHVCEECDTKKESTLEDLAERVEALEAVVINILESLRNI